MSEAGETQSDETQVGASRRPDYPGLERLVFFSDAVFAIAITLLALDIRLPPHEGGMTNAQLRESLIAIWPSYMGYVISFLVIGFVWMAHHRRFRYIIDYDRNLLLLNLVYLMTIAFVPFSTSVISEYGNQTATIFYALSIVIVGIASFLLWWYASHGNRLVEPDLPAGVRRKENLYSLAFIGVFALSIAIAYFIDDNLAKYSWLLLILTSRIIR